MSPIIYILNERKKSGIETIEIDVMLSLLDDYTKRYDKMSFILNKIYINRNIALNEAAVIDALKECDVLMRDNERD